MLYPEQNEARLKLSLDGTWAFALGSCVEDQFDPAKPLPDAQPIAVPASYNDQNDQTTALRRHYGWAWYQRKVTMPAFCAGQRVALRFGSVTHTANVWLNGQLIVFWYETYFKFTIPVFIFIFYLFISFFLSICFLRTDNV